MKAHRTKQFVAQKPSYAAWLTCACFGRVFNVDSVLLVFFFFLFLGSPFLSLFQVLLQAGVQDGLTSGERVFGKVSRARRRPLSWASPAKKGVMSTKL